MRVDEARATSLALLIAGAVLVVGTLTAAAPLWAVLLIIFAAVFTLAVIELLP